MMRYYYHENQVEPALLEMLRLLAEEYPLFPESGDRELKFIRSPNPGTLEVKDNTVVYGDLTCAARGLCCVMSGITEVSSRAFRKLGVMLDCSRNGVMTVEAVRRWLRHLALMGYNQLMLYTETTYKLPDEPYFGYMNGAYTLEEIREIDAYAAKLGIEVNGCIQVLGHLHNLLKWFSACGKIKDTKAVLKVDEPQTYELIGKMLDFWSAALSTRRIHVGMDETFDIGLGAYLRENGYVSGFELFNRHLAKVNELCGKRGLKPMIWSDMYFRLGSRSLDYYDPESVIPDSVRDQIPKNVDLVYWDYYHTDKEFYVEWIKRHRALGFDPVMASGVWTWTKLWHEHRATLTTVKPCIDACLESSLQEFVLTMWGDDGEYCDLDSALSGLILSADWSFGLDGAEARLEPLFRTLTNGASYRNYITASRMEHFKNEDGKPILFGSGYLLWDDPLLGIAWNNYLTMDRHFPPKLEAAYRQVRSELAECRGDNSCASLDHAWLVIDVLYQKLVLRNRMVEGYQTGNRAMLQDALRSIPEIVEACRRLSVSFRRVWLRNYKPFGLEVIQIRQGGLIARLEECALTLGDYLDGKQERIPQLDEVLDTDQDCGHGGYSYWATASTIF